MAEPFRTRRRARDEKREAVLRAAARLFLEVGYRQATLNQLAERLGITKPSLYNYFRSKEDILAECYRVAEDAVQSRLRTLDGTTGRGSDRLRELIRAYAYGAMDEFARCLIRLDERELSSAGQGRIRDAKRRLDRLFRATIEAGIADQSLRACDPRLAAYVIAGSLNWIGHWYEADGLVERTVIAETFADQLTAGLLLK